MDKCHASLDYSNPNFLPIPEKRITQIIIKIIKLSTNKK
jgi:hypothetical protein